MTRVIADFYSALSAAGYRSTMDYARRHTLDLDIVLAYAGMFGVVGPHAFVEVLDSDGETPIDLCCWLAERPDLFAVEYGAAPLLGLMNITPGRSVVVHPHPLDWMKAGCSGVVPLPAPLKLAEAA